MRRRQLHSLLPGADHAAASTGAAMTFEESYHYRADDESLQTSSR